MPTGYTACIGEGADFQKFVLGCARAFGALITMRDEPSDAPIPEKFEPSNYHVEQVAEARRRQAELEAMTPALAEKAAEGAYRAAMERHEKYIAEKNALREKYTAMLQQVNDWKSPSPDHAELKKFMREQIEESIRFDCTIYEDSAPKPMTGKQWLAAETEKVNRDITYHSQHHADEIKRANGRTEWVRQLRESLK